MAQTSRSDEQVKLIFDHTKHLTTLSAGSIVAIVTFYDKLASHHWKASVGLSLICFVVSIIAGLLAQITTVYRAEDEVEAMSFLISWITFSLGMLALGVYGVRNFY